MYLVRSTKAERQTGIYCDIHHPEVVIRFVGIYSRGTFFISVITGIIVNHVPARQIEFEIVFLSLWNEFLVLICQSQYRTKYKI